jgi:hypothetical protein
MLITWAAVLFAIAALGGATLATLHFRGRSPLPMPLALLHGLLAAGGLVLLVIAALTQPGFGGLALASLVIFVIAALGYAALALSTGGLGLLALGGRYGGRMVYEHGVGRSAPPEG